MRWSDAQSIARQTGRALFVARENMTRLTDLKKIKQEMITAGVEVLGTVFNQPPKSASASGKPLTVLLKKPFLWLFQLFSRSSKGDA